MKKIITPSVTSMIFLLSAFSSPLFAKSETDDLFDLTLEELFDVEVEIATGKSQPLSKAPAVASVITASEIAAMGLTDFSQVLSMVPGVHVYLNTGARLDSQFSIRGIHTVDNSQVLVLVNGNNITEVITGSRPSSFRLPVANVARIEVMRSPGSALYGADAFAGVINVITKDSQEVAGAQFGWRQGSFNTQDTWLLYGGELGQGWSLGFALESSESNGDDGRVIESDFQTFIDGGPGGASYAPGSLATRYDIRNMRFDLSNDTWKFSLWNWRTTDSGMGQGGLALDPIGHDEYELSLFDAQHEMGLATDWRLRSRLSFEYIDQQVFNVLLPPGATTLIGSDGNVFTPNINCPSPATSPQGCPVTFTDGLLGNPGATERQVSLNFNIDYQGFEFHQPVIGFGVDYYGVDTSATQNFGPGVIDGTVTPINGNLTDVTGLPNTIYMGGNSRTVQHFLVQDEWRINPEWSLTTGVRFDHYSDFGNTTNPRVALVWAGSHELTSKLLMGRAFRAPSFGELYFDNNPVIVGHSTGCEQLAAIGQPCADPELSPETIETLEWAFDYRPTKQQNYVLSLFSYQIKNLITRLPTAIGLVAQNSGEQKGRGFELEANWHVSSNIQLRGFYAHQDSENNLTGEDVHDAPGQQLYASAHWGFKPDWFLGAQAKRIADRKRVTADKRPDIKDYTLVDLTLRRRQLLPNMELVFSARNVFDEDAREPSSYNAGLGTATVPNDFPLAGRSFYGELSFSY